MKLEIYENNILDITTNYTVQQKSLYNNTIIIVDNFYKYPQHVRNFAIKLPCLRETDISYTAEVLVPNNIFIKVEELIKEHYPHLSKIVKPSDTIRFRFVDCHNEEQVKEEWHTDGKGIAGIIFLNERQNSGGTSFKCGDTILNVEGRWNRLILFPMTLTHKPWFDDGVFADSYRITQLLAYRIRLNKILENK